MKTACGEQLRYQQTVSVGPASLPVHRTAVRLHCRLGTDVTEDNALLDAYIREATESVELHSGRALVMQTRKTFIDQWPFGRNVDPLQPGQDVEVRGCPVAKLDSVTYTDNAGAAQTWSSSAYQFNSADEPSRLRYVWGGFYPVSRLQEKSIVITTKNGYAIPITANLTTNVFVMKGFTPVDGDSFRLSNSGGTLPAGLELYTDYFIRDASGSTFKLALTSSGTAIDITTAGTGLSFLGEINPQAIQAIYLRVAMNYVDREGADYKACEAGYWARINSLRYEGP